MLVEKRLIQAITNIARLGFNKCEYCCHKKGNIKEHTDSSLEENDELFLFSHHKEGNEYDHNDPIEVCWDVLLAVNDGNVMSELEKKEVLKLHKYFAHRNGKNCGRTYSNRLESSRERRN